MSSVASRRRIHSTDDLKVTFGGLYSKSESDGSPQDLETFDQAPGIVQGNYADWLNDALVRAGQPPLADRERPAPGAGRFHDARHLPARRLRSRTGTRPANSATTTSTTRSTRRSNGRSATR